MTKMYGTVTIANRAGVFTAELGIGSDLAARDVILDVMPDGAPDFRVVLPAPVVPRVRELMAPYDTTATKAAPAKAAPAQTDPPGWEPGGVYRGLAPTAVCSFADGLAQTRRAVLTLVAVKSYLEFNGPGDLPLEVMAAELAVRRAVRALEVEAARRTREEGTPS